MTGGRTGPAPGLLPGAAVIAVGSELLRPRRRDRNTPLLKERLADLGIPTLHQVVAADDHLVLAETLRAALARHRFVLAAGGLGPTADDRTRGAAAAALAAPLVEHAPSLRRIESRFRERGYPMPAVNRRQALLPEGAEPLPNPAGTAPGVFARARSGAVLLLLPGPPRELAAMFDAEAAPRLAAETGGGADDAPSAFTLGLAGLPESTLEERLADLYPKPPSPLEVSVLASGGEISLRVSGPAARRAEAAALADRIADRLGRAVHTRAPAERLEHAVGRELARRGERAAVAESLTGGLIAERLTRVPGASGWFDLGVAAYANEAKTALLGVPPDTLAAEGAVSRAVAEGMAEGVRRRAGNAWGLAVTGIAGPGGGSRAKPVGLVWIAVAGPVNRAERHRFPGDRPLVRRLASTYALDLLRRSLLTADRPEPADRDRTPPSPRTPGNPADPPPLRAGTSA